MLKAFLSAFAKAGGAVGGYLWQREWVANEAHHVRHVESCKRRRIKSAYGGAQKELRAEVGGQRSGSCG